MLGMNNFKAGKYILTILLFLLCPARAWPHGGNIDVGDGAARGPVHLDAGQQAADGLKTVTAGSRKIDVLLYLNGELHLSPDHQADVSMKTSGQIDAVYVRIGDEVKAGQPLARVEPRLVGNKSVLINAPMKGVIDFRNAIVGMSVDPGTKIFHIADRSHMTMLAHVYEEDIGKIAAGQAADIEFLAWPEKIYKSKVGVIEPDLDDASRTVLVRIPVDNSDGKLLPHMFARVGISLKERNADVVIPNDSIIEANGERFVFVKNGDMFSRVDIVTGASDDSYTEVTDGLVPGDEVVTQGKRQVYTMWLTGGHMEAEE
ncbi:MAG: efflux RND transporter periplasmic adaptor subunit [Alphaproteobacteria bacterium]|nr:efflux RND transporter periplasmic adaptor subunit [Alphaproteobacteria bacterium]